MLSQSNTAQDRRLAVRLEPRLLKTKQAAEYLNIPEAEVKRLTFGRVQLGSKLLYDRHALDAELDRLSGLESHDNRSNDNEAEAAFDRFTKDHGRASRSP